MELAQTTVMLSQYGLYAIVAILCACVVYLYQRIAKLEDKFREALEKHAEIKAKLTAETKDALRESTEAIRQNTIALSKIDANGSGIDRLTVAIDKLIKKVSS